MRTKNESLQQQLEELEYDKEEIEEKLSGYEEEIKELEEKLSGYEEEIEELSEENGDLELELAKALNLPPITHAPISELIFPPRINIAFLENLGIREIELPINPEALAKIKGLGSESIKKIGESVRRWEGQKRHEQLKKMKAEMPAQNEALQQQEISQLKHHWGEAFKESEIDRKNLAREIELHRSVAHQLRAENEELKATKPALPSALELLNEFRKRCKKPTIGEIDVEIILDILGGESDDDYLPAKEIKSLSEPEPIESLALSVRAYNCLKRAEINTIQQLLTHTPQSLLSIEKLGKTVLAEITSSLQRRFGLALASEDKNES